MFRHSDIWRAIDRLAAAHGLSASGLARRAGLDPTTFNPSKREGRGGKHRWPSTESLAKILSATDTPLERFVDLMEETAVARPPRRLPLLGHAEAGCDGYFTDGGFPSGVGWDQVAFPDVADPAAYALEISGDSMLPLYRDGDRIIVSPASSCRRGDRVVAKLLNGEVVAKELARITADAYVLRSFNPDFPDRTVPVGEVEWIARIVWASQ
jgi:phage repressor protein C with HTH and peptisase S24 domain